MNVNLSQETVQSISQMQQGMNASVMVMEIEDFFIENHSDEDEAKQILVYIKNLRFIRRMIEKIEKGGEA